MMFETNIENNPARISLARAAQLTGYHQDYLGQLCRLGKLEAVKVGRNWFTSPAALNNLSASISSAEEIAEEIQEEPVTSQPVIAENITIAEVDGMPIAIRAVPLQVRNTNSVQGILTNLRIESLQKEVMELRQLLFKLMEEVKSHTSILQTRETVNRVQDSLKHSYVSNFDFSTPEQLEGQAQIFSNREQRSQSSPVIWQKPKRKNYVLVNWVAATAAVVAIGFLTIGIATNTFFGQAPSVTSFYYQDTLKSGESEPEVAGAVSEYLPTDSTGDLVPIMIR